jgi:amidase
MERGAIALGLLCALGTVSSHQAAAPREPFLVAEKSITDLRNAMQKGETTSRAIVQAYLDRIARYDPALRAVITTNPRALAEADALDQERRRGHVRGPLHGIPIALKDNLQTTSMRTTGGALAFAAFVPPYEATLAVNLRRAGALIIAKTSMTELANWIAADMPNNYNAVSGQGVNPYGVSLDPGGSSSGIGTAANFWAANVGTETSGSILTPASETMLAAIKPTVGRISRRGVIPITADQDTPGPMAKFVSDAALLLGAMEGARPDPHDPATKRCMPPPRNDYTRAHWCPTCVLLPAASAA